MLTTALTLACNQMIMHCMKRGLSILLLICFAAVLSSCVLKPPVQEMSDARTAIKTAQELPGDGPDADATLKSAETALDEATRAMEEERYERARAKALEAKRHAQQAARIKQHDK